MRQRGTGFAGCGGSIRCLKHKSKTGTSRLPNMEKPNSWIIQSSMEITLPSLMCQSACFFQNLLDSKEFHLILIFELGGVPVGPCFLPNSGKTTRLIQGTSGAFGGFLQVAARLVEFLRSGVGQKLS